MKDNKVKKCKCGGIIKTFVICGVDNHHFNPYFKECNKCLRVYKIKSK